MSEEPFIARARARLEEAGLTVEPIDREHWRVTAPDGGIALYWPGLRPDIWRQPGGKQSGRGVVTLIAALMPPRPKGRGYG